MEQAILSCAVLCFLNIWLDSAFQYLVKNFWIYIHEKIGEYFPFLLMSLASFEIKFILALLKKIKTLENILSFLLEKFE